MNANTQQLLASWGRWGVWATWPSLFVYLMLLSCLIAATAIDAKYYIIPLPICWTATAIALVIYPLGTLVYPTIQLLPELPDKLIPLIALIGQAQHSIHVTPKAHALTLMVALGATAGLAVALVLLYKGVLPQSFAEEEGATSDDETDKPEEATKLTEEPDFGGPDEWLAHPHPRREILKECLFLLFPIVGALLAWWLAPTIHTLPLWAVALGGALQGYFVGAALVWGIRILGTLAFGKEAMGLGDVHLLAAIGAVMGATDAVLVFFVAPFIGLLATLLFHGIAAITKRRVIAIPYGPYLAAAALVVMILHNPLMQYFGDPMLQALQTLAAQGP